MDGPGCSPSRSFDRAFARTYAAWERFAAGAGDASDVPLSIALSWHRCRDVYRIDPATARPQDLDDDPVTPAAHGGLLAELGAVASAIAGRGDNRVATVTDGSGAVLAAWGTGAARRRAPEAGLRPAVAWSEARTGTNAIGTPIVQRRVCAVRGPEHWSPVLHHWSCTGVAFCEPVTGAPLATLTVASWRDWSPVRPVDLLLATEPVGASLRAAAARHHRRITEAFAELAHRTSGPLVALDLAGRVVAANGAARCRGAVTGEYAVDRPVQDRHDLRSIGHVAPEVRDRAREDPAWRGAVSLWSDFSDHETYRVIPVVSGADPIAFLACADPGAGRGEPLDPGCPAPSATSPAPAPAPAPAAAPSPAPAPARRVPALGHGGQIVLLRPVEIRYARADGHVVWLVTERGRLRAARRGIDQIERDLSPSGFLRVHRSYLVNLARIRDVAPAKDRLTITTGAGDDERIPVSRRYVPAVRHALGL